MPTARRDPRWDNAKFLLILLVVFGHAIERGCEYYGFDRSLFLFIYSFHMPAFLFISGLFSKRTVQADKYNWRKLVPYVFICFVLSMFRDWSIHIRKPEHGFSFYDQSKISWFMLAIFASYSFAWLLRKFPPKYVFPATILVGLAVGYVPFISEGFSLSRIIVFFPFFYAGYMLDRNRFAEFLDRKSVRAAGVAIFAIWFVICFVFEKKVYLLRRLFTGQNNYDEIPNALGPVEFLYRGLAYLISALVIVAFFTMVPRMSVARMTELGARTLSVYFWHLPVLDIIIHRDWAVDLIHTSFWFHLLISVVLGVGLTYLFSWKPFTVPVNWMLNPWPSLQKLRPKQKSSE